MPILTDNGNRATACILSEAPGHRSRDNITIVSGAGILAANTVLSLITASGKYTTAKAAGADGSQTAVAVLLYPVDATASDVDVAALTNDAEVNIHTLVFDPTINSDALRTAKLTQLRAVGIKAR